tara:strand:- start:624 stop:1151 length:528 start_codon:yes stop_codon:yes gene_type:complete
MELCKVFIPDIITDKLFFELDYKEKIQYSYINKYTYSRYRILIKNNVHQHINNNYKLFYGCIKRFDYDHENLIKLRDASINGIKAIISGQHHYYDLRFIFELIYLKKHIYEDVIYIEPKENLRMVVTSIVVSLSFNRFETINNINNNSLLYPLWKLFKPLLYKTCEEEWSPLYIQ